MRKSLSIVFAFGFMLALVSVASAQERVPGTPAERALPEADSEASVLTPNFFLSNNLANPDVDAAVVKCKGKTTISADVLDVGPFNDNTVHVTVFCISPKKNRAVEKEQTDGGLSPNASVSNCKEAVIQWDCELNDFCDDEFNSVIDCAGKDIKKLDFISFG